MADVFLYPPAGGSSYTPPTYTPGSVLFADGAGAPTQDNAEFFYDGSNLLIGTNTGANGRLHIKAADDVTGNLIYAQNNANDTFFRVRNLSSAVQDAYITATLDTNQNDATILFLSSTISNTPRFNFYADGWLQFSGAAQMGTILPNINNTFAIQNGISSGGIALGYESDGVFGADPITQLVSVGFNSAFTGTGVVTIAQVNLISTYNQGSGAGVGIGILDSTTLTSITGSYTGYDFNPTVTSVAALYGIRIRSTVAASAFGHNATPDAFVHVGQATGAGVPQIKFELGGTILATPENGTLECNNTHLYWTDSTGTRFQLDQQGGAGLADGDYGDITVSGVGTILTIDNMSSATLAGKITDETGTGVLVFGTSPTFTTSVVAGSTTMTIFNTVATTVSAFGAATTLNIGNTVTSTQAIAIGGQVTGVQTITIGAVPAVNPTGNQTITIGGGASSAGSKLITIGINGGVGSTTEIEMGSSTTGTTLKINLSASDATGDMLYKSSATTISRLAIGGTAGMVLTTLGGVPTWSANFGTTSGVITASTIELGHATANTLSASGGIMSIEGVAIPTISSTHTFTNKRITQRVVTTADDSTAVIDVDVTDQYQLTAMANATTISTTGTPTAGQHLVIRLKDNGTARALTWDSVFRAIGVTLPTTTTISKTLYIKAIYNLTDTKWDVLAVGLEA